MKHIAVKVEHTFPRVLINQLCFVPLWVLNICTMFYHVQVCPTQHNNINIACVRSSFTISMFHKVILVCGCLHSILLVQVKLKVLIKNIFHRVSSLVSVVVIPFFVTCYQRFFQSLTLLALLLSITKSCIYITSSQVKHSSLN